MKKMYNRITYLAE